MASLFRIGKSKLSQFSRQFKSFPQCSLLNPNFSHAKACLAHNPHQAIHNNHTNFGNNVRFFAAPIQFQKASKEEKELSGLRMNEEITAEVVRVVIGKEHSIVSRREALLRAKQLNLDLVEVEPSANPPVCKVMDYNREKYEKELKKKERVKTKGEMSLRGATPKEIRFSGKTEQKDLELKALNITRLMEDGYRVKCTAKGTVENDVLGTLSRLCDLIGDVAVVESGPTLGKNGAYLLVRHIKFGQKKGGMKKLKDLTDESSGLLVAEINPASNEEFGFEINEESFSREANMTSSQPSPPSNADINYSQKPNFGRFSAGPNAAASPRVEASSEVENRYGQKGGAKNQFSPTKVMDHKNLRTMDRDSMRSESQISNQGRQPPRDARFPQRTRQGGEAPTNGPGFRNHRPPLRDAPNREPFSPNAHSTPRPGYGQFSGSKANNYAPGRQSVEPGTGENNVQNRYAARHPVPSGSSPTANQKPDGSQPAMDRSRQGGFGVYSR